MSDLPQIYGDELIEFIESTGCNKRDQIGDHATLWSVYTGCFFVVPSYKSSPLDSRALEHIIWNMGVTTEGFMQMWNEYKSSKH